MTDVYGSEAQQYDVYGNIVKIDIFYAVLLRSISTNREEWLDGYLSNWKNFSREEVGYHECDSGYTHA